VQIRSGFFHLIFAARARKIKNKFENTKNFRELNGDNSG
jgi:hypothetical protein